MIIIVDSGSTKADWQIIEHGQRQKLVSTMGFNPFFHNEVRIELELQKTFIHEVEVDKVTHLYFYGAGCSDAMRCEIIQKGLARIFKNAHIEVQHDLLACARATCGNDPGISCIIGTGSNTCAYDGSEITDNISNLGYLLGDEGSGSHLGKLLVRAFFYRELPSDIEMAFIQKYGSNKREFLNKLYGEGPNVYLASFATFFSANRDHFYIQKLVSEAFTELIERHILKYKDCHEVPIHFVGSIAHYFQDILNIALEEHNLKLGDIVRKPIDNLVDFHLKNFENRVVS
jgi:glucosamine kinase